MVCIKLVICYKKDEIKGIKLKKEDGTHGTADWMSEDEIEKVLGKNETPGIILGKSNNDIVKLPFDSYFNKNIAVFGSSGSMKTIGFLITNLLELFKYKKSIIVTDAKGEIYRKTNKLFRDDGYVVKVFNLNILGYTIMAICLSVFVYVATLILFKNTIMQECFKIIKMRLLISIN